MCPWIHVYSKSCSCIFVRKFRNAVEPSIFNQISPVLSLFLYTSTPNASKFTHLQLLAILEPSGWTMSCYINWGLILPAGSLKWASISQCRAAGCFCSSAKYVILVKSLTPKHLQHNRIPSLCENVATVKKHQILKTDFHSPQNANLLLRLNTTEGDRQNFCAANHLEIHCYQRSQQQTMASCGYMPIGFVGQMLGLFGYLETKS